jgi:8-oxo-dGTP diphosphatase
MNWQPKFCPQCGGPLSLQQADERTRPVCTACGRIVYLNPAPSVAAILNLEGRFLLVKRNIQPGFGRWGLPGGFIETDESVTDAVRREVEEETGLICRPMDIVDALSVLGGFYGDIVVICYAAEIVGGVPRPGGDASEVEFFSPHELPDIAFDVHRHFIQRYVHDGIGRNNAKRV